MKKSLKNFVVAMLVVVMISAVALAGGKKNGKVTFSRDMTINGTVVKKGTYKVVVNEETNELSLIEGKNTVVTSKYQVENHTLKNNRDIITFTAKDNANHLNGIGFQGESEFYSIGEGATATANPQH